MRKIEKKYDNVPAILKSEREKNDIKKVVEGAKPQPDIYRNDEVLNELDKLYFKKCGYCETITNNYKIEHYRPKDVTLYPYLAYEWSNIFPVCHHCNHSKGNKFPVKIKNTNKELIHINDLNEIEDPIVLNPEVDNPNEHFDFNIETGEIVAKTERAKQTIKICDLNSDDLIFYRKDTLDEILVVINLINVSDKIIDDIYYHTIAKLVNKNKHKKIRFSMYGQKVSEKFNNIILPKFLPMHQKQMKLAFQKYLD
ncbi:MAG: TIGR02646 family protein [Bacteroidales bacterium]|nr:TIGR02646 family protein [Bacteroidales bacterium]